MQIVLIHFMQTSLRPRVTAQPSFRAPQRLATHVLRRATALLALVGTLVATLVLAGCGGGGGGGDGGGTSTNAPVTPTSAHVVALSAQAALGDKIFSDVSLSASGRVSCASCHSEANAASPANDLAVQLGGVLLDQQGKRSAPSLDYLSFNTAFHLAADGSAHGGFSWDGRAASLSEQAVQPLLGSAEMANTNAAGLVAKLARAPYANEFKQLFGADIFNRPDDALARLTLTLQQYQLEDRRFRSFSSKYDEFLRGKVALTRAEQRGLALFNSPSKGNCQSCHTSGQAADGSFPLFTDFSYDNLGVPRNTTLAANADPLHFDLGLCDRPELATRTDLCGAFRVPSLRNVARRHVFFHNGRFASLKEALTFYVQRDTNPEKWYPQNPDGSIDKFNDLPAKYRVNVNLDEAPYNRQPGDAPALSDAEVDDVITFLHTLSDGFVR